MKNRPIPVRQKKKPDESLHSVLLVTRARIELALQP